MSSDDLLLGSIAAYRVAISLEQFYLLLKLRHTAVDEERIRLARDLHDGLLQSVTGIAFRLQSLHRLMNIGNLDSNIPENLAEQIHFIVREAIINAAKHSGASTVKVKMETDEGRLHIAVADNGCGFSFRGHYDHDQLRTLTLGPSTIKERVGNLGGTLSIESTENGAHLKIGLPLSEKGG